MIAWIQKVLWDEAAFERYLRVLVCALGIAMQQGLLPTGPLGWWLGLAAQAGALLIGAGDKNPPCSPPAK